ncbi:MAG: T9SS type A sorting domain-containing protein [Paludibacteraceae bacterium]
MKKIFLLFILVVFTSIYSLNAQDIQFDYDDAGNCIVKYKTVVLPSHVKGNNRSDSTDVAPESEIISDREVVIYPNPTKGELKIEIRGKNPEKTIQYLLTDLSGRTIYRTQSEDMFYVFDMTSFPAGVYLLRVMIDNKWSKWKIIKE